MTCDPSDKTTIAVVAVFENTLDVDALFKKPLPRLPFRRELLLARPSQMIDYLRELMGKEPLCYATAANTPDGVHAEVNAVELAHAKLMALPTGHLTTTLAMSSNHICDRCRKDLLRLVPGPVAAVSGAKTMSPEVLSIDPTSPGRTWAPKKLHSSLDDGARGIKRVGAWGVFQTEERPKLPFYSNTYDGNPDEAAAAEVQRLAKADEREAQRLAEADEREVQRAGAKRAGELKQQQQKERRAAEREQRRLAKEQELEERRVEWRAAKAAAEAAELEERRVVEAKKVPL